MNFNISTFLHIFNSLIMKYSQDFFLIQCFLRYGPEASTIGQSLVHLYYSQVRCTTRQGGGLFNF